MTAKRWDVLITAIVCAGLGAGTGLFVAWPADDHAHDQEIGEAADDHDHAHFEPETLADLGVVTGPIVVRESARTTSVVATVVALPSTLQPVQAPLGGVVETLLVEPGEFVAAGQPVAILLRPSIAPPALELTRHALVPDHGELHTSIRGLREARIEIEIVEAELARIADFTEVDGPVLPLQRRIDLDYRLERARVAQEIAHHELELHGFSEEQVERVAKGEHAVLFDAEHVRRTLVHSGLWHDRSAELLEVLPDAVRTRPIAVAAAAELQATGRLDAELAPWLADDPAAGAQFLEIASLLLQGRGLDDLRRLVRLGALRSRIELRAPERAEDWDVVTVHVRVGDQVLAGEPIVTLRDPRRLRLRVDPLGSEVSILQNAVAGSLPCSAMPLVDDTGPVLEPVRLDYVAHDPHTGRVHGWARIDNQTVAEPSQEGGSFRSWALYEGLAYRLQVPVEAGQRLIELPRSAVATEGAMRLVFVPTGDGGFEEIPIAVAWEDEERVALDPAANPRLEPGTDVVLVGAFELGLAMHADEGGGDHHHDH
jgi:multidrug efflux pump subunit AcrA (membrane-fusion protein)